MRAVDRLLLPIQPPPLPLYPTPILTPIPLPLHCTLIPLLQVAEYLIGQGAEIESMDNQGMTVLHASAMDGNYEMTHWLLMRVRDMRYMRYVRYVRYARCTRHEARHDGRRRS